jgi:hypothetical protein
MNSIICKKCKFRMVRIPLGNYQDKDFDHEYIIYTKCINPFCKESAKGFSLD